MSHQHTFNLSEMSSDAFRALGKLKAFLKCRPKLPFTTVHILKFIQRGPEARQIARLQIKLGNTSGDLQNHQGREQ
jgi:hypothetical protein